MSTAQWVIIAVIAVGVIIGTILIVRHVRYRQAIKDRGWAIDTNPALGVVLHHAAPPFGLGLGRKVDNLISGTSSGGVPFGVFEYSYDGAGANFDAWVASLKLPVVLPPIFAASRGERAGVLGEPVSSPAGLVVRSPVPAAAMAVLTPAVHEALRAFGQPAGGVDISIDGEWLVAVGAPKDPEELQPYLEALGAVARAIDPAGAAAYAVDRPASGFTFFGRPDWVFAERDDSLINLYQLDRGGHSHEAQRVVRSVNDGLRFDALLHEWKTTHTRTVSDGEGRTRTETYTETHHEPVLVVNLPFDFGFLNVNAGWGDGGKKVQFESETFNDAYKVRATDARYASDVIHPRMMELITAWRPYGFVITGRQVRFEVPVHDQFVIAHCADFVHAFFGLVPGFVWSNLRVDPPQFRTIAQ